MPEGEFSQTRLFVADDLAADRVLDADADQARYLLSVLRLSSGDTILLFNGRDGEWRAEIRCPTRKRAELVPREKVREQTPASDLHYLFAPLKTGRLDYMVQKATEMGAGVLRPVMTQHCQMPRLNLERCAANIREAAEQCGILSVPQIREMARLEAELEAWDEGRTLFFCDEDAPADSPLSALGGFAGCPLALLVGPEGGFSQAERSMLRALPYVVPLSLGPRILRADTAAVAVLALVQAVLGDAR